MFDNLKQLAQLKSLQDAVKREVFESSQNGVRVVVTGALEVQSLELNSEIPAANQAATVKECVNQALKKAQQAVAQKLMSLSR